jgi:hypothetical protein
MPRQRGACLHEHRKAPHAGLIGVHLKRGGRIRAAPQVMRLLSKDQTASIHRGTRFHLQPKQVLAGCVILPAVRFRAHLVEIDQAQELL